MKKIFGVAAILLGIVVPVSAQPAPTVLAKKLDGPTAVSVGPGGKIYVAVAHQFRDKDPQGGIMVIENGKAVPFATGLSMPWNMVAFQNQLFVTLQKFSTHDGKDASEKSIWRIDAKGKAELFVGPSAFLSPVGNLRGMTVDPESGTLFVSESTYDGVAEGRVYRISSKGKVDVILDKKRFPGLLIPEGVAMDGASHILLSNFTSSFFGTGDLYRVKLADGSVEKIAAKFAAEGLASDHHGRVFGSVANGFAAIPRPGIGPLRMRYTSKFGTPTNHICLDPTGKQLLTTDWNAGELLSIPINIPGWEVDESPLSLKTEIAFPDLKWTGWEPETKSGKPNPLRPLVLTHAGDGSNRVFVATEHGVIHVFPNDQKATKTDVFLDITDRVSYRDDQNEEGFLGLCFHPKYKETGEFFVFYTPKKVKNVNVLSRFRVSKDDPNKADPESEEELMRFTKPFWNHDGGTICFGPDGYLYVTHGDGGAANDPFENGQNLKSLLGKIHRIDVNFKPDAQENSKKPRNYGIPKDNPFVGRTDGTLPEIWAYGLRNVWRMAFDRKTGKLWAGDVGQNLWEEIDIIEKGGNYGWNRREGLHPFGPKGTGPKKEFIDPIWEYHHDIGKSITGGGVYRGPRHSELDGAYIYGDYVSMKIWALKYDEARGRVVANRPIKDPGQPIFSFGEDEKGEMYMLCPAATGKGIFWFVK
jgi:glucose/arabinose dehydrogenase